MIKQVSKLGNVLSKEEQQSIHGGRGGSRCSSTFICPGGSNAANGTPCYLLSPNGQTVPGTMNNGLCCAI